MSISLVISIIILGGWFSSKIVQKAKAPGIMGMLLWGIAISILWKNSIPGSLWEIAPFFKSLALIVILLRAGLGINRAILKQMGITAILMGFVPFLVEAGGAYLAFTIILGFPHIIAALSAFMLAAVSPAVVIPSMLDLKASGHGAKKQVPTIILAGASLDNAVAFSFFTLALNMTIHPVSNWWQSLINIPYALLGGIGTGLIVGYLLVLFFRHTQQKLRATEKILILITVSFLLLELGNSIKIAALLGTMTTGFVLFEMENQLSNELAAKLKLWWIVAEIVLFVLIGMSVDTSYILKAGGKGLAIIGIGLGFRSLGVLIATAFSRLNKRERVFCIMANLPKGTVQAALGSVPLAMGIPEGNIILAIAVISILVTAPVGLFLIETYGKKLL